MALRTALIVVLVLLVICLYSHLGMPLRALPGFWSGSDSYLQEAGLADMCLYVADRSVGAWGRLAGSCTFDAFLLIATREGIICNQKVQARFRTGARLTGGGDKIEGSCRFSFSDPESTPWPERLEFTYQPLSGVLCLHDDGTMLAYLHRDAAASEAAAIAANDEGAY